MVKNTEQGGKTPDERRCPICHERGGHSLSCPTRWYPEKDRA